MSEEKTEKATPRKLRKSREEGQVVKSEDLAHCAALAAVVAGMYMAERTETDSLRSLVDTALGFVVAGHDNPALLATLRAIGLAALHAVLPLLLLGMFGSIAARATQVGFHFSFKPVEPKFEKVDPASGLKRIFSAQSLVMISMMTVKSAIVGAAMWVTIRQIFPLIAGALYQPLGPLARVMWELILKLLIAAVAVFLVIGNLDYLAQRAIFMRKQRMSKDEVKREYKDSEGDPGLKSERKRLAHEMIRTKAPKSLAAANMLVVNPTHYAVAVCYQAHECPLPVVIAKGVDAQAAVLRRLADDAGVPIVANPPVARALYEVPTDEPIPEELFEVVAAILRWVEGIGAKRQPS